MKVLSIGSAILDKISFVKEMPKKDLLIDAFDQIELGGCAANVSVALAQLGIFSSILCSIGRDTDGHFILQELISKGVDTSKISMMEGKSGYCKCYVDQFAERDFFNYDGVNLNIDDTYIQSGILKEYDALYVSGYELLEKRSSDAVMKAIRLAKKLGRLIYFDPAPVIMDIPQDILDEVLMTSNYVVLNKDEANAFGHTLNEVLCAKIINDRGAQNVIIKLGNLGCFFYNHQENFFVNSIPVDAIDTNGAGDAFMAGLIYAHLQKMDEYNACRYANAVASVIVRSKGSQSSILSLPLVEDIVRGT